MLSIYDFMNSPINYQLSSNKEHKMGLLLGGIVLLCSSGIPLMKMKWSSINYSRIIVCLRGPGHKQRVRSIYLYKSIGI